MAILANPCYDHLEFLWLKSLGKSHRRDHYTFQAGSSTTGTAHKMHVIVMVVSARTSFFTHGIAH